MVVEGQYEFFRREREGLAEIGDGEFPRRLERDHQHKIEVLNFAVLFTFSIVLFHDLGDYEHAIGTSSDR